MTDGVRRTEYALMAAASIKSDSTDAVHGKGQLTGAGYRSNPRQYLDRRKVWWLAACTKREFLLSLRREMESSWELIRVAFR